jgi:hypothetical protein
VVFVWQLAGSVNEIGVQNLKIRLLHTKSFLLPRSFHHSNFLGNLIFNAKLYVAFIPLFSLIFSSAFFALMRPQIRRHLVDKLDTVNKRRTDVLTASNTSYSSPMHCFSLPFTQLTQTPGPSMNGLPQSGVPSWYDCNEWIWDTMKRQQTHRFISPLPTVSPLRFLLYICH